jgi:hypothetical protein
MYDLCNQFHDGSLNLQSINRHYRKAFLCRAQRLHGKGAYRHGKVFAVLYRTAKFAPQRQARQRHLCHASGQTRTTTTLSCMCDFAVRFFAFAVRVDRCDRAISRVWPPRWHTHAITISTFPEAWFAPKSWYMWGWGGWRCRVCCIAKSMGIYTLS